VDESCPFLLSSGGRDTDRGRKGGLAWPIADTFSVRTTSWAGLFEEKEQMEVEDLNIASSKTTLEQYPLESLLVTPRTVPMPAGR